MSNIDRIRKIKALAKSIVKEISYLEEEMGSKAPESESNSPDITPDVVDGLKGLIEGFGSL